MRTAGELGRVFLDAFKPVSIAISLPAPRWGLSELARRPLFRVLENSVLYLNSVVHINHVLKCLLTVLSARHGQEFRRNSLAFVL